jgi:hypothetical protein
VHAGQQFDSRLHLEGLQADAALGVVHTQTHLAIVIIIVVGQVTNHTVDIIVLRQLAEQS